MCANIEFIGNFITSNSRYMAHARFLGDVLADKSIGVFIGFSFQEVVERGKKAGNRKAMFIFFVAMGFGTIIKCSCNESLLRACRKFCIDGCTAQSSEYCHFKGSPG